MTEVDQATRPTFKRHDALCSLNERVEQLASRVPMQERTRTNLVRALESVDPAKREAFLARHGSKLGDIETLAAVKYADLGYWAHRNVLLAQWLDLDRKPPLDILDIGTGSGNFAMVAKSMGHRAIGTDVWDPWYDELCNLTGVERVVAPVKRGEPYRPTNRRFDLITMMLPAFHRKTVHGVREYWSVEDWRLFLTGLVQDLLQPQGAIFILLPLDKDNEGNLSYSPLVEWSRERGARLDRTSPRGPVRHILFDPATEETFGETPPEVAVRSDIVLNMPGELAPD
jgi:hypothetical protein